MKKQLMIVEDCFSKFMVTKQILACSLRMPVRELQVPNPADAIRIAIDADRVIVTPKGGAADLLSQMRRQNINRRNTEVTLVLVEQEA